MGNDKTAVIQLILNKNMIFLTYLFPANSIVTFTQPM